MLKSLFSKKSNVDEIVTDICEANLVISDINQEISLLRDKSMRLRQRRLAGETIPVPGIDEIENDINSHLKDIEALNVSVKELRDKLINLLIEQGQNFMNKLSGENANLDSITRDAWKELFSLVAKASAIKYWLIGSGKSNHADFHFTEDGNDFIRQIESEFELLVKKKGPSIHHRRLELQNQSVLSQGDRVDFEKTADEMILVAWKKQEEKKSTEEARV